jgi:hypothetical protein
MNEEVELVVNALRPALKQAAGIAASIIRAAESGQADPLRARKEMAQRLQDLFRQELTQALSGDNIER